MNFNSFAENLWVQYLNIEGPIRFICHQYITICVNSHKPKQNQTNILVYKENWSQVTLLKESYK